MPKPIKKTVKAWILVTDKRFDIDFDLYETKSMAMEYKKYREDAKAIIPCTITYQLPVTKKK